MLLLPWYLLGSPTVGNDEGSDTVVIMRWLFATTATIKWSSGGLIQHTSEFLATALTTPDGNFGHCLISSLL